MKKGTKHTEESKRKLSKAHKGKHHSIGTEFKKGMVSPRKGKKLSE